MNTKNIISLICIYLLISFSAFAQKVPVVANIEEVSQLPSKIPQRVTALAYDGKKLWFAIYLDRGRYVKYDPISKQWDLEQDSRLRASIPKVTGEWASAGGMTFVDGKMWLGSAYGESFGWIDVVEPSKIKVFSGLIKPELSGTPSFADLTHDGENIWAAWHSFNYREDRSRTQVLLKIDRDTGDVLGEYPLPQGSSADGTHGLAWDGSALWHAKGKKLTKLDKNGVVMGHFDISKISRPSGLAWDGESLWIVEFTGKLWKLPFITPGK